MSVKIKTAARMLAAAMAAAAVAGCSWIEEDMSDCGTDYRLDYELRLVTNISTELQTQLGMQTDVQMAQALRRHLSQIFTDHAHDVDLSFYDVNSDSARLQHDALIMDASQHSYTLYLPMRRYMHLAVANVMDNAVVDLGGDAHCHTSRLTGLTADTIDSHTTGLFTARQPMEVLEGVNQTFNVRLYMANCAAALIVDPRRQDISSIRVYATGLATDFNISDSTYVFPQRPQVVRTSEVTAEGSGERCYCAVGFPSREPAVSRTVIETTDPFVSQGGESSLWQLKAYVTLTDGSTTETVLNVQQPLRAGQLKIIRGYIDDEGAVRTDDQTVGVSVTLDWNNGGRYEPEL